MSPQAAKLIAPIFRWAEDERTLWVTVDHYDYDLLSLGAMPLDPPEETEARLNLLQAIQVLRDGYRAQFEECQIKVTIHLYDGEPL